MTIAATLGGIQTADPMRTLGVTESGDAEFAAASSAKTESANHSLAGVRRLVDFREILKLAEREQGAQAPSARRSNGQPVTGGKASGERTAGRALVRPAWETLAGAASTAVETAPQPGAGWFHSFDETWAEKPGNGTIRAAAKGAVHEPDQSEPSAGTPSAVAAQPAGLLSFASEIVYKRAEETTFVGTYPIPEIHAQSEGEQRTAAHADTSVRSQRRENKAQSSSAAPDKPSLETSVAAPVSQLELPARNAPAALAKDEPVHGSGAPLRLFVNADSAASKYRQGARFAGDAVALGTNGASIVTGGAENKPIDHVQKPSSSVSAGRQTAAQATDDGDDPELIAAGASPFAAAGQKAMFAVGQTEVGAAAAAPSAMPGETGNASDRAGKTQSAIDGGAMRIANEANRVALSPAETASASTSWIELTSDRTAVDVPSTLPSRGRNNPASSVAGTHPVLPQAQGGAMETLSLTRIPVSGLRVANLPAAQELAASGSRAAPAMEITGQDTIAALDSTSGVGAPTWTHAGSQNAEAGFADPTLGWVGVRAGLSGVNVHAAVVPGSIEAAMALSAHLPGLGAYLQELHAPVASLTVASPEQSGPDPGAGQNTEHSPGQNPHAGEDGEARTQTVAANEPAAVSDAVGDRHATASDGADPVRLMGNLRGTHISVMA